MVGYGNNMYAKFHHSPRLQGSVSVLVFNGITQQLFVMGNDFMVISSFFHFLDPLFLSSVLAHTGSGCEECSDAGMVKSLTRREGFLEHAASYSPNAEDTFPHICSLIHSCIFIQSCRSEGGAW
jgi:hypothetical protein